MNLKSLQADEIDVLNSYSNTGVPLIDSFLSPMINDIREIRLWPDRQRILTILEQVNSIEMEVSMTLRHEAEISRDKIIESSVFHSPSYEFFIAFEKNVPPKVGESKEQYLAREEASLEFQIEEFILLGQLPSYLQGILYEEGVYPLPKELRNDLKLVFDVKALDCIESLVKAAKFSVQFNSESKTYEEKVISPDELKSNSNFLERIIIAQQEFYTYLKYSYYYQGRKNSSSDLNKERRKVQYQNTFGTYRDYARERAEFYRFGTDYERFAQLTDLIYSDLIGKKGMPLDKLTGDYRKRIKEWVKDLVPKEAKRPGRIPKA